jgi:hypothetical protein
VAGVKGKSGVANKGRKWKKRNRIAQAQDRTEMIQLLRRGWTQADIAAKFGLHQSQVSYDLKLVMKERWTGERTAERDFYTGVKLEEFGELKRELWASWLKSKIMVMPDGSERECPGRAEYIREIVNILDKEAKLLALYPDKELIMKGTMNVVNWDVLAGDIPEKVPDEVEQEIAKAITYRPVENPGNGQG